MPNYRSLMNYRYDDAEGAECRNLSTGAVTIDYRFTQTDLVPPA